MKRALSELLADCENVLSFNHWDAGNLGLGGIYVGLRLRDVTAAIPSTNSRSACAVTRSPL